MRFLVQYQSMVCHPLIFCLNLNKIHIKNYCMIMQSSQRASTSCRSKNIETSQLLYRKILIVSMLQFSLRTQNDRNFYEKPVQQQDISCTFRFQRQYTKDYKLILKYMPSTYYLYYSPLKIVQTRAFNY